MVYARTGRVSSAGSRAARQPASTVAITSAAAVTNKDVVTNEDADTGTAAEGAAGSAARAWGTGCGKGPPKDRPWRPERDSIRAAGRGKLSPARMPVL